MGIFTFMSLSFGLIAQVMSHDIKVDCGVSTVLPMSSANASASLVESLDVEVKEVNGNCELQIRWVINVDVSNKHLTGTRIVEGSRGYLCKYSPSFANASLTSLAQLSFEYIVPVFPGYIDVMVANLPLPPVANGLAYKTFSSEIDEGCEPYTEYTSKPLTAFTDTTLYPRGGKGLSGDTCECSSIPMALFGVMLAGFLILASCVLLFKTNRQRVLASGDFSKVPGSSEPPVSVLLVYPAECPAFQKTVVALAEYLLEHAGCTVAVDLWQQGQIAKLGPMRWVAGQAKTADRVLIVCPQPISCHSNHRFLGPSVPASANDLYPLVLNMVASRAKNPSELAMFWALQLGKSQDKRPRSLPGELTACKLFSLTEDLDKLCRSLHNKKQGCLFQRTPHMFYSKERAMKLQDAIKQLAEHQFSLTAEQEHVPSGVIAV